MNERREEKSRRHDEKENQGLPSLGLPIQNYLTKRSLKKGNTNA
jgi:hypothetical protein